MRSIDWDMSQDLYAHWLGIEVPGVKLCQLLADLDRMLKYFDEVDLKPWHAICPCPECGDYHRWVLLRELMSNALTLRPPDTSKLLGTVDKNLEPVRALYGGEKGMQEMRLAAANFFASVANRLGGSEADQTPEQIEAERLKAPRRNTHPGRSEKLRTFLEDEPPGNKE